MIVKLFKIFLKTLNHIMVGSFRAKILSQIIAKIILKYSNKKKTIKIIDYGSGSQPKVILYIYDILKNKHNISNENGKLAIYLSEEKENLETITKNENSVEVMIFKQAIALGWDCPRASILVLFRDHKSIIFYCSVCIEMGASVLYLMIV